MRKQPLRIFVVFKTHFDIGFTGLVDEVLDGYANVMVPQALDACRKTAANEPGHRYVWTLPAWPLAYCLRKLSGSALGKELEKRVLEGAVVWHALPFTTHTELFGLEDLTRGLYIGRSMGERFGRKAVAAKMTDVPGHTWILPTLLWAAGIRFLHLGCNPCSTPPEVPPLFLWEGPDGSRIRTMYSRGGYGTGLLPPLDWTLPVWLALQHTNDNAGPQSAEVVQQILQSVRESSPGASVVFGTLDDFARALDELNPDLPVVRKDLADSWIHGAGTMPVEVSMLRELQHRLVRDESAIAVRSWLRGETARSKVHRSPSANAHRSAIAAAYEKMLLFVEHTWGMDTKLALNPEEFGGRVYDKNAFQAVRASGRYARIQKSWADKKKLVAEAQEIVQQVEARLTEGEPGPATGAPATFEVVNHHLWEWTGRLKLGKLGTHVKATIVQDGSELPVTVLDNETWVTLRHLAPLSLTRVRVEKALGRAAASRARPKGADRFTARVRASGARLTLQNGRVSVRVDTAGGGVVGLIDCATGRDWVDRKAGLPFGGYQYDVYSRREIVDYLKSYAYDLEPWFLGDFGKPGYPEGLHRTFTGTLAHVTQESGAGWARLRLLWKQDPESVRRFGNAAEVTQSVTVFDDEPWVDMDFSLVDKEASPLLEAGHVVLPLLSDRPKYAINKTGSVVDPARDIEKNCNRLLYCCERWTDVSDRGGSMLIIPRDTPLFSIGSPAIERFDGAALPGRPVLYFNLFNTQWGTNFPQWLEGNFRSRFRLIPHAGNWRSARAWELAAAALQPPSCLPQPRAQAEDQGVYGLLDGPARGLETVTLKAAEDGSGMILRLREPSGRAGARTLRFHHTQSARKPQVIRCSLLEEEQEPLSVKLERGSAVVAFSVRPFEVLTLKMKA